MTTTSRSDRPRPSARSVRGVGLALLVGLGGCTATVRLLSEPDGATVHLPDGTTVVTPADVRFRTLRSQPVRVEADGYRTLEVDLRRTEGNLLRVIEVGLAQPAGREVTFLLIEEHAPTGSGPSPREAPPPRMR